MFRSQSGSSGPVGVVTISSGTGHTTDTGNGRTGPDIGGLIPGKDFIVRASLKKSESGSEQFKTGSGRSGRGKSIGGGWEENTETGSFGTGQGQSPACGSGRDIVPGGVGTEGDGIGGDRQDTGIGDGGITRHGNEGRDSGTVGDEELGAGTGGGSLDGSGAVTVEDAVAGEGGGSGSSLRHSQSRGHAPGSGRDGRDSGRGTRIDTGTSVLGSDGRAVPGTARDGTGGRDAREISGGDDGTGDIRKSPGIVGGRIGHGEKSFEGIGGRSFE